MFRESDNLTDPYDSGAVFYGLDDSAAFLGTGAP